jgi:hypothetical protein
MAAGGVSEVMRERGWPVPLHAPNQRFDEESRQPTAWQCDFMMHYNFVRIHQSSRCTPAMAPSVTTNLWEQADRVQVLEQWEAAQERRER